MASNRRIIPTYYTNLEFYTLIGRLKDQNALSEEFLLDNNPFFNLPAIPKETEVRELFRKPQNEGPFNALFQQIKGPSIEGDSIDKVNVLTFAQICLYKILPCPQSNCPNRPREIVTHNRYKDNEYQCPFYHHERDRRRIGLSLTGENEFIYKANYFEEGRTQTNKDLYSQNYFESMFHPMYYKMFRCKSQHEHSDEFCPFYHSEQEKNIWDKRFYDFMKKDRVTFVKDKQKYYEKAGSFGECKQHHIFGNQNVLVSQQDRKKSEKNHKNKSISPNVQMTNGNILEQYQRSLYKASQDRSETSTRSSSRKDSGDSFNLDTCSQKIFNHQKQMEIFRSC